MAVQLGIILAVSLAGEALGALVPLPIPASVWGLCLMLALLTTGAVKVERIRKVALWLVEWMPVMFVPATVGLMQVWDVLAPVLVPFLLSVTVVTALVMAVSGRAAQFVSRRERRRGDASFSR